MDTMLHFDNQSPKAKELYERANAIGMTMIATAPKGWWLTLPEKKSKVKFPRVCKTLKEVEKMIRMHEK